MGVALRLCAVLNVLIDEDSNDSTKLTDVWSYFEREGSTRARCAICRMSISAERDKAKRHLQEKHPKLILEIADDSESQQKTEEDDQGDLYTEVVYLEDPMPSERKKTKKDKAPVKWITETPKKAIRHASTSSDEVLSKKVKKNEEDEELEKFGTYITCLLKKLPRDVCMKLQMNIVNLIMNANLSKEEKMVVETVPVTIQTVPNTSYFMVSEKKDPKDNQVTVAQIPGTSSEGTSVTNALSNHTYAIISSVSNGLNKPDSS